MNNLEEQNAIFILPKSEEGLQSSACSAVISGIWHRFRGTGGEEHRLKTLGGKPLNGSQEEWVARWGMLALVSVYSYFWCWFLRKYWIIDWLRLMPVLVILTRYLVMSPTRSEDRGSEVAVQTEILHRIPNIFEYMNISRACTYVFVLSYKFIKQINTGQNWSWWGLHSENFDSPLWHFFYICCTPERAQGYAFIGTIIE